MDRTVNIRGKEYTTVSGRVNDFRERYTIADGWGILTSIEHIDGDSVVMRAEVTAPGGRIVATGYAEEMRNASKINQTSALENCETSAIGRALAACGLGGTTYASAEEAQIAIARQESSAAKADAKKWSDNQRAAFCAELGRLGLDYREVARWCESRGHPRPSVMGADLRAKALAYLKGGDRTAEIAAAQDGAA